MSNRGYNRYDKDGNYIGRMEPIPEPPKRSWGDGSDPIGEIIGGVVMVLFGLPVFAGFLWVLVRVLRALGLPAPP